MDERIYLSMVLPYGELTHGVADPRGERLAPGSLRHAKGRAPRLYLAHAGDLGHYRIPAGRLWEAGDEPAGLHLVFELHRTAEGRRAAENAADSTMSVSPELIVISDRTGPVGERLITEAILHAVALTPDPAYAGAKVTAIETASERRAARLTRLAAVLDRGQAAALEARRTYAPPVDVAKLLAVKWDPGLADQHRDAAELALLAHRW
jgi:phage head maturation protease